MRHGRGGPCLCVAVLKLKGRVAEMAMWRVVAQQETRDGRWSGSVQLPTFYVEAVLLSEVIEKALGVLWEGRQVAAPVHLTIMEQVPAGVPRSFDILRDGDEFPDGGRVVFKRVGASLQQVIGEQPTPEALAARESYPNQSFADAVCSAVNGNQRG